MPPFLLLVFMGGRFYGDRLFLHPLDRLGLRPGLVSIGDGSGACLLNGWGINQ